jgi:hypothetical protein
MRLSSLCLAARFILAISVIFLLSPAMLAQHSSGGGGSSGGSSSSGGGGGGGSHSGGSSGGSSSSGSSGGGHSSGGSASPSSSSPSSNSHSAGGSGSHGSSGHSSSAAPAPSHATVNNAHSNNMHSVREPNAGMHARTETPEKRTFFSFLRHPFRKPEPKPEPTTKPVADLRRPICLRGRCAACPTGQARVGGVCGGRVVSNNTRTFCQLGLIWNGNACVQQTRFPDDCSAQRIAMERQARSRRDAEAAQRRACAAGLGQECSDMTSAAQSEADLYRTLQDQYRTCQQRSLRTNPFGHPAGVSSSHGRSFDPFEFDLDYR